MRNVVFQGLAEAARSGEPVALGLITGVAGSSPQKAGAKALFHADGRIRGTLGGGCLEAEIQRRALEALRSGQGATFELVLDHDFGWDDGLLCGGKVNGLILPNAQKAGEQFWRELAERQAPVVWGVRADFSLAAVAGPVGGVEPGGSPAQPSPAWGASVGQRQRQGTPGRFAGAGGGGKEVNSLAAPEWLYQETVTPACALWIAGAGHIAQAVAPLALGLDFSVTVFDDRPALANRQYFPPEVALHAEVWEKLLAVPLPPVPSFGLIVTRGHRHDALVLANWIHQPFRFLGMIGSARKARTIFEHLVQEKLATAEELGRVACPVGVRIRCQSVPEIAVSIMAQFIDKRAELAGGQGGERAAE
ncbi:MAG: XdhC family protein [Verrucomicrobiota bacterium]|jgi:xanthine dehydrogenase accessory factor